MSMLQKISEAIEQGNRARALKLLDSHLDLIEEWGAYWMTLACANNDLELMQQLADRGCDIQAVNFLNQTALQAAAEAGAIDAAEWLLERGAALDDETLASAVENDRLNMVQFLIEQGADPQQSVGDAHLTLVDVAQLFNANEVREFLEELGVGSKMADDTASREVTESKPLSESDCRGIEKSLKLKLPADYRSLLRSLPRGLWFDAVGVHGVITTASEVVSQTRNARSFKEEDWENGFPDHMIVIGGNGGGDLFCVDANEDGSTVYLFDHENGSIDRDATQSLEELVQFWSNDD